MSEEPEKKPALDPSILDDLLSRTRKFLREIADDYIKHPIEDLLRWTLGRVISYLVAAALFITAAVFLMVAGVEGLKEVGASPAWAYLGLGIVGLLAGILVLRATRPPDKPK